MRRFVDSRLLPMPEHIDDFIQVQNAPDTMSFLELRAYVARLRDGGHRVTRYLVQLYSKLSFPLVHVIMALVAIPFALVSPRSGGRAMGIGVAIVIAAGYWVVHSVAIASPRPTCCPPRWPPGPPTSSSPASAPPSSSAREPRPGLATASGPRGGGGGLPRGASAARRAPDGGRSAGRPASA